ncbi:MAG TPA: hypothetical protein ENN46_02215 [Candidatus Woesearchaeota archaeon]|nr:hypothetical protein [Candidatus Woesearchaeota archaeon]
MKGSVLAIVFFSTFLNSIAQMLFKVSSEEFSLTPFVLITNFPLIGALFLYFLSALLLITALKRAELSVVYPIIASGFIWVAVLSFFIFGEALSLLKIAGIITIFSGIFVLSQASKPVPAKEGGGPLG